MAILEFINGKNKTYSGLKKVIKYILRADKTRIGLYGGKNCDADNAYNDFILTKRSFSKETGRQYIHFVQSFSNFEKIDALKAKKVADELLKFSKFKEYQIVYATHTDTDNLHTHFVLNTVNSITGEKWRMSKEELEELKDFSDNLCRKFNLTVTHGKKGAHVNRGEYRSKDNQRSWKYEMFLAINEVRKLARSKEDFIEKLNVMGYETQWSKNRKYITFVNSEGKKCRNRKLYPPEKFTKEALLKQFEMNRDFIQKQKCDAEFETLLSTIKLLQVDTNVLGDKNYPLSSIEGTNKKDAIKEAKKNAGLNWKKEKCRGESM